jgi:hypothetical protein
MTNHDLSQPEQLKSLLLQLSTEQEDDILNDLVLLGDRPEVLSLVVYKLAKEREHTNKVLEDLNRKYDNLVNLMSNQQPIMTPPSLDLSFLTEQDTKIVQYAISNTKVSANEIKELIGYKGLNAASQRLNKLNRDGYLDKKRIGQKTYFFAKE